MSEHKQLVPKLRFPEFRGEEEWNKDKVINLVSTLNPPKKLPSNLYLKEGKFPIIDQAQKYICGFTNDEDALISTESSLIIFGDHTCVLKIIDKPFVQGADGIKILKAKKLINPNYLYQYLLAYPIARESYRRHFSTLQEKTICFPKIESKEQQKIAGCLSSIDESISTQTEKLNALKKHKKALMQQLFPDEGETTPKLRFPGFRGEKEWNKDKVINLVSTLNPPKKLPSNLYLKEGKFPIIDQAQKYICGFTNDEDALISTESSLIIFGDHTCVLKIIDKPFVQGADGIKILKAKKLINPNYLYQYLLAYPIARESYRRHFSTLQEKTICFPKIESKEQQKIAGCLSSIDDLITAQAEKIDMLQTHKKGLMQRLFPTADKMSA